MRFIAKIGASGGVVLIALLAVSAPAATALKPIRGELTKPGYTVSALADDGEVISAKAGAQRFRLVPPAKRVSLHLRAADGTYAGPLVVEREGKRAVVGVEAGAKLGTVKVKAAKGYAKPKRELAEKWVDDERTARATGGVPIGAGNFGHVRSASAPGEVAGDTDLDGIPDPLDVDDDGDLILDTLDSSPAVRAPARSPGTIMSFRIVPFLPMLAEETANSHVGSSDAMIEQTLPRFGRLGHDIKPGGPVELDCGGEPNLTPPPTRLGGLVYCSSGGTGRLTALADPFDPGAGAFPDCCDGDGDGFGEPPIVQPPMGLASVDIDHHATSDQIGTGDELRQHVATGGDISQCPEPVPSPACASYTTTLPFVFATGPALASYDPEVGDLQQVNYPINGPFPPLTVNDGPDEGEEVSVRLTFFRAQRRPTPLEPGYGEEGKWMDLGSLVYSVGISDRPGPSQQPGGNCPQGAFSDPGDELVANPPGPPVPAGGVSAGGVTDTAPDRPASTEDTITFTLNFTQCLGNNQWQSGEDLGVAFQASNQGASADQSGVRFKMQ